MVDGGAAPDVANVLQLLGAATSIPSSQALSQWHRLCPPRACPVANPRAQTLHLWPSHLGGGAPAVVGVLQLSFFALDVARVLFLPLPTPGRAADSMSRLAAVSRSCTVNWSPAAAATARCAPPTAWCWKCGGGVIPRHWRSGWHRMWPNSAFHDLNTLPHSVHGGGSPVGEDLTLANAEEEEEATPSARGLRACSGLGESAQANGGGGSASASVSVVSW